ncbi:probable galacturonosyltransferase 7 isoform X3 [Momordica charantia]|uniref:Hexosyltransferase n=1 Tax=Momordica charantia TaxID=3673 RepID=A0A6J1DPZ2_MOMCH|nr:probable galacturonosyltransferase 7 isoform X3 [Momordica charantia]
MKGGVGGGSGASAFIPAKRRWRGLVIGVLGLVILSMLVPLVFLLGLYNGFHTPGYPSDTQNSKSDVFQNYAIKPQKEVKGFIHDSQEVKGVIHDSQEVKGGIHDSQEVKGAIHDSQEVKGVIHDSQEVKGFIHEEAKDLQPPKVDTRPTHSHENSTKVGGRVQAARRMTVMDESGKPCEWKFGSYCIWRQENREVIKDSMVKKLKDQLFVARAYYPSIAKLPSQSQLSQELKQNIQELERVLSESTTDLDLPAQIEKKSLKMEAAITKAKSFHVDCNNVDKKLRQIFDLTEDEANFHMKQSAFLFQLAVQTMPKTQHCLSMQLTVEYFRIGSTDLEPSQAEKYADPTLNHYIIFSNNILASSVVINSTVMHAKESGNQVFHVLTDGENYFAMKLWFSRNSYKEATVEVLNVEHIKLNDHKNATLVLPQEFRVSFRTLTHSRTEYISMFSHLHYLLPEIFKNLEKVVVLEADVVVQRDLSALWSLDMGGKVNGAVQFCQVRLGELKSFLGENGYDQNDCSWMSGLNVIDLAKWRELDLSRTFRSLVREQKSMQGRSTDTTALRASLLTFQGQVYALDDSWSLYGLGHDYKLNAQDIENAATLHYNGYLKPWLELGIPKYKAHWKKFLDREDLFLSKCNINP